MAFPSSAVLSPAVLSRLGVRHAARRLVTAVVVAAIAVLAGTSSVRAQVDPQVAIRSGLAAVVGPQQQIDEIRPTPVGNLYEVRIGTTLLYVDARGEYAFIDGQLIDLRQRRNLTRDRIDDLMRIDFRRDLPLDKAIRQVHGSGKRVLAVFEDPNCTYCRKLRADFDRLKDVTIYTFPYPILAPDSDVKSRKAWCAKDRAGAWNAMLARGTVPDNDGRCDNPVADVRALGRELGIEATPTMFFPSGKRVPGAISLQQLETLLDSEQVPAAAPAGKGAAGAAGTTPADKSPAAARRSAS